MASGWSIPPQIPQPWIVMNPPRRATSNGALRSPMGAGAGSFGYPPGPPPPPAPQFIPVQVPSVTVVNQRRALLPCPSASSSLMGHPMAPFSQQYPVPRRRGAWGQGNQLASNQPPGVPIPFVTSQPIRLSSVNPNVNTSVSQGRSGHSNTTSHVQVRSTRNSDSPTIRSRPLSLASRRPPTPAATFGSSPPLGQRHRHGSWSPPSWSPPSMRDYIYDDDDDLDMVYGYRVEFEPYDMFSQDSDDDMYAYYTMHQCRCQSPPARLQGGYEAQFVTPLSSELQHECSICLSILREPFLVDCCGYRFCKTCIKTVENDHKPCPLCNEDFSTFPDKQLQRMLNQKDVYCKHKDDGCEWTGALSTLDDHLNVNCDDKDKQLEGCEYTQLKCSHCESLVIRKEFKLHTIRCSGENYTCEYCDKYTATYRKVTEEHWPKCPNHPVECPDCKASLKRSELQKHSACDCPQTIVPCDLTHFGCDVHVPRIDMASHIESATADHVSLLIKKVQETREENEQLKLEFADVAFELQCQQEMNTQVQTENEMLLEELEEKESELEAKDQEIEKLRKKLAIMSTQTNKLPPSSHIPPPGKVLISPSLSSAGSTNRMILITNLPPTTNEQKLKSLFGQFGRVAKVTIMKNSVAVLIFEYCDANVKAVDKSNTSGGINLHGNRLTVCELRDFV